ncbi:hypothetical protein Trydic_g6721 [Trypoxylus dichotomus]
MHRVLDRGGQISGTLYPLLIERYKLDRTRKIRVYKTVHRSIVTCASAVWATAPTTHMNKLQTLQNRILQMDLNAPWFVRNTILKNTTMKTPEWSHSWTSSQGQPPDLSTEQ